MQLLSYKEIYQTKVIIRGAGDLASGIAHRLFRSGFKVCLVETSNPLAVRRMVSFCEAVYDREKTVEDVTAVRIDDAKEITAIWENKKIPLLIDPENMTRYYLTPHVVVDAILAKRNLGTQITDAPLVVGLGPGFFAGRNVHVVIETNRGHNLGRLIFNGEPEANTGEPGVIGGFSVERVFRAPRNGIFRPLKNIGEMVGKGEELAQVNGDSIHAAIPGIIRGILRDGTKVTRDVKAGDIDPRANLTHCSTISDKARALGGAVLEAILFRLPRRL